MNYNKRNRMIEENLALVNYSLQLLGVKYNEDYFQQGVLELIRCVDNFDESRGIKFSTYAINNIKWYLKEYIQRDFVIKPKRTGSKGGKVDILNIDSLDRTICSDGKKITLQETLLDRNAETDIEIMIDEINIAQFFDYVSKFYYIKERDINIFKDFHFNGWNKKQLCKKYKLNYRKLNIKLKSVKKILQTAYLSYNKNKEV